MKILGLDMSTTATGWALWDKSLEKYGVLRADEKDISGRLLHMRKMIKEVLEDTMPDLVVMEEVPISDKKNLITAKNLCLVQGIAISLCCELNLPFKTSEPSHWRSKVGANKTLYTCDKCEHEFVSKSALNHLECSNCGNTAFTRFRKKQLNTREELKKRAVDMVNEMFGFEFIYKKRSNKSDDDIAEAILLGLSERKSDGGL